MTYEKRLWRRRKKNIFTIIIFIIIAYLLFSLFFTFFKKNTKTILPEKTLLIDSIFSQGFLIKEEYIVKSSHEGIIDLFAAEGERIAAGRKVVSITTLNDTKSLEYELKEIKENISLLETNGRENEFVIKENNINEEHKEELILELQKKILANEYSNIVFLKEQLLLYEEEYGDTDAIKTSLSQGIESLKERKKNIELELEENHIKYYTNRAGVISYEIDGYEEEYLPKDFEDYTYESLKLDDFSKTISVQNSKVSANEPIFKIMNNFQWYLAIKIENSKETIDFNENANINIYIDDSEEELVGNILSINNSGEKVVIIAKFNTMFYKHYNSRFPKVEIIKEKINGYKIPKKSIVSVDSMNGVYIKERTGIVRFKPISIFKEDNNYVYIYSGDEKTNIYLNNKSEPVKTISLFDEIIISPNNIEEGDIL